MSENIALRIASFANAYTLAHLNHTFNEVNEPPEHIAARIADPNCPETPILAEIDGQVVGFAAVRIIPCVFYSEPHAELLAQSSGAPGLVVLTSLTNHPTQAFYHNLGYRDDDLALWKDISQTGQK